MWKGRPPKPASVRRLRSLREEHDLAPLAVHGCYLTNLASVDPVIQERSRKSFRLEIENARAIGADYLVIHPGSAKGQSRRQAVEIFAAAVAAVEEGFDWGSLRLLLENTAGGGATLGRSFEELSLLQQAVGDRCAAPVAFCIDTAHCYEAGYDVSTEDGLQATLAALDEAVGIDSVRLIHANDSKTELGSNRDRHESIGDGHIGSDAFARMLAHERLRSKPFILETPFIDGSHEENVRRLWALAPAEPASRSETGRSRA